MTGGLRREELSVGLHVGLLDATGQPVHGVIEILGSFAAYVWIGDTSRGTTGPIHDRGYQARITYETAEAGGMWAQPPDPASTAPPDPASTAPPDTARTPAASATGADLLAFWALARRTGLVGPGSASMYQAAIRRVLAAQPQGLETDVTVAPAEVISRFTAKNQAALAPATVRQYASGYRRARKLYLDYHDAGMHPHRLVITLGSGRSIIVTMPGELTDADRELALKALTDYLTGVPAPEAGPVLTGQAHQGGQR